MKHASSQDKPESVRIVDPYLITLIVREQKVTGEGTASKTAARLITERLAQLESTTNGRRRTA